jgi:hypothetical protein
MGLFSAIGNFLAPGIGGMVGGLVDSSQSSGRASDLSGQIGEMSEKQYQRELPWDVSGQFGGVRYDREGRAVSTELSAPWQSSMDSLLGRAASTGTQIDKYSADPMAFGHQLAQERIGLHEPADTRAALSREARAVQQGQFGTTGFAGREGVQQDALNRRNQAYEVQGFSDALKLGTSLRDWQKGDTQQAINIGKLPMEYLGLAQSGGISNDPYAGNKVLAAGNEYQQEQKIYDALGNEIKGMLGGLSQPSGRTVVPGGSYTGNLAVWNPNS